MSNSRLSAHVPDATKERVEDLTGDEDVESDVIRDALQLGLDELERERNRVSTAMVLCAQLLAIVGAAIAALGFVTRTGGVLESATVLLAGAIGLLAFENIFYGGGSK